MPMSTAIKMLPSTFLLVMLCVASSAEELKAGGDMDAKMKEMQEQSKKSMEEMSKGFGVKIELNEKTTPTMVEQHVKDFRDNIKSVFKLTNVQNLTIDESLRAKSDKMSCEDRGNFYLTNSKKHASELQKFLLCLVWTLTKWTKKRELICLIVFTGSTRFKLNLGALLRSVPLSI
ncbi:DUF148 domain-containing protein [Caenorhabditis elegans]|uniref:DUF148 domain-containing protein n=1 Tax=Caenorhabditis elegans TaxID=6239 RepID=O16772_CAEEL|nr:DUF148 domain-containing protein [Caenorhabditis elegans]CCD66385.2 DUF148 domain-containing protein [Caenorhabditis elegans]|eukprot:NP_493853.2 Uncharacterized protein CELE_R07C3.13 [Caenorhabditis elegans]